MPRHRCAFRSTFAVLAAGWLVAGCSSTPSLDPRTWFGRDSTPAPAARELPGVEARLRGLSSAATGVVRVRETGDLLIVFVQLGSVSPGPYRAVFHDNANCTSPNGFSAGAPWTPPGAKDSAARLLPELYVKDEHGELTARLRGVRMGPDMLKRSVLIYAGSTVVPPKPNVPNDVVACGTFVPSTSLF